MLYFQLWPPLVCFSLPTLVATGGFVGGACGDAVPVCLLCSLPLGLGAGGSTGRARYVAGLGAVVGGGCGAACALCASDVVGLLAELARGELPLR